MKDETFFHDKTILITGGTGSFGKLLAKTLLAHYTPKKVIIFSRDEWKQWEMQRCHPIFKHPNIRYFLGDVRDVHRLKLAFAEVDYVVHTAALKQVPFAEYNPSEFVKTNVNGAANIIEAAIHSGVKKVIALSTDKACYPVNLYGATKLCSDKLFVNGNAYVGSKGYPVFSVVRYGNVLGSRGSIIPEWEQQINEGAECLYVTDERMTRFWITLHQAVDFVLKSLKISRGGEIFVPKIPSMKLVDMAKAVAPNLPIKYMGIREGEKIHEIMISIEDARHSREYEDHYMIIPETHSFDKTLQSKYLEGREGKILEEGFSYRSESNNRWLDISDLRKLLLDLKTY